MKRRIALLAAVTACAAAARAGPLHMEALPPKTRWCIHLDMAGFRGTGLGRYLTDEVRDPNLADIVRRFREQCAFHPVRDVADLTLYGTDYRPGSGVLLIRGKLDSESVLRTLRATREVRARKHGGYELHEWTVPERNIRRVTCFYRPSLTVVGSRRDAVARALDVLERKRGSAGATAAPAPVMEKGVFLRGWAAECRGKLGGFSDSILLASAHQLVFALGEEGERMVGELRIETEKEEEAGHLHNILLALLALAILRDDENPAGAALASRTKASCDGTTVRLRLNAPTETLRKALEPPMDGSPQPGTPLFKILPDPASSAEPSGRPGGPVPVERPEGPGTEPP